MFTNGLSYVAWALFALWSRSLKVAAVGEHSPRRRSHEEKSVIYAFWHDSMFLLPALHRGSGIVIMVSASRDGEIAAGMLRLYGYEVVRGSSKRKGYRALIGLICGMRRGRSVAIAVDGPRGPRHQAKDGALYLAGRMGAPIIPVATRAKRGWTLERTWGKFVIPVPFTEGVVRYGQPIMVNGTSKEEIAARRSELEESLRCLTMEAASVSSSAQAGDRLPVGAGP